MIENLHGSRNADHHRHFKRVVDHGQGNINGTLKVITPVKTGTFQNFLRDAFDGPHEHDHIESNKLEYYRQGSGDENITRLVQPGQNEFFQPQ